MSFKTAPRELPSLPFCLSAFAVSFSLFIFQLHARLAERPASPADSGSLAKLQFDLLDDIRITSIARSPEGRYITASNTQGQPHQLVEKSRANVMPA